MWALTKLATSHRCSWLLLHYWLTRATASDHYSSPAADGSRPGVFYAVIEDPTKYRTTGMTTLFLHEGQPGHHYHIALQQELPLPKFRSAWVAQSRLIAQFTHSACRFLLVRLI